MAARTLRGLPISFPGTTGVAQPISGGLVSHP
jgi:anhydro-N-acetylmuramic acid kinase